MCVNRVERGDHKFILVVVVVAPVSQFSALLFHAIAIIHVIHTEHFGFDSIISLFHSPSTVHTRNSNLNLFLFSPQIWL